MPISVIGISHKTAPHEVRSRLAFAPTDIPAALADLTAKANCNEAMILSTCNRTEIYFCGAEAQIIKDWLIAHKGQTNAFESHIYQYQGRAAITHAMRVACSLNSMVLGEPQIFGQMKEALATAKQHKSAGRNLNKSFQQIFAATKKVRHQTAIGHCPVSVAYFAVNTAKNHFNELGKQKVLIIGAGETAQLAGRHLKTCGASSLKIANRSLSRALILADELGASAHSLDELETLLPTIDVVIAATNSPSILISKAMLQDLTKPLFLVDIAAQANIDPQAKDLQHINLIQIDDIAKELEKNTLIRSHAAIKANEIIEQHVENFFQELQALEAVDTIRGYRQRIKNITHQELAKSLTELEKGKNPEQVMQHFAHRLTQKIMHKPSTGLHKAGKNGQTDILSLAQDLFALQG